MDVERFATALPELFDDFPRSPEPRGRRFDDVIRGIPNLAEENVLALLNLAASLLPPGESYVEVGTYHGASLIGAMRGNTGDFVAVDAFTFGPTETKGRELPAADRAALEENLRRFGCEGATILEGDAFELLEGGALGDRRVGVYYYDGPHDREAELRGLRAVGPWLAEEALIVVDDHDWERVSTAVQEYLAGEPGARLLFEIPGEDRGHPQWWEGVAVLRPALLAAHGAARARHRPLGQVVPVRALQGLDHARVGVPGEEDVPVDVAADLGLVEVEPGDLHQRLGGQLRLPDE